MPNVAAVLGGTGVTLREMASNPEQTYACGEPGGVFHSLLPESSRNTARRVLEEAANTGDAVPVTARRATLTSRHQPQEFRFPKQKCAWVKLVDFRGAFPLGDHGIAEFEVYGKDLTLGGEMR